MVGVRHKFRLSKILKNFYIKSWFIDKQQLSGFWERGQINSVSLLPLNELNVVFPFGFFKILRIYYYYIFVCNNDNNNIIYNKNVM